MMCLVDTPGDLNGNVLLAGEQVEYLVLLTRRVSAGSAVISCGSYAGDPVRPC